MDSVLVASTISVPGRRVAELMEGSGARSYPHVVRGSLRHVGISGACCRKPGRALGPCSTFGVIDAEQRACTASASSADLVRASAIVKAEFNGPLALRMVPEGTPELTTISALPSSHLESTPAATSSLGWPPRLKSLTTDIRVSTRPTSTQRPVAS